MDNDTIISVKNVSKVYRIWNTPGSRLTTPILESGARLLGNSSFGKWVNNKAISRYKDFWALDNIDFEVKKGESVAIIGRNGSGKSTLLQIIAGTLQASNGAVKVHGRVAALLELGSGFNPDFTGRENVYLNGAVLGLTRQEIDQRFDEIAAFADIGEFMEQPVKTYSSGMMVRLAFATQTVIEPEILIVDEALSVGDFFFQQKCATRMNELRDRGTTVLFVSHDMSSVRNLCPRALYLRQGRTQFWGDTQDAISLYFNEGKNTEPTPSIAQPALIPVHDSSASALELKNAYWRRESMPTSTPAEWLAVDFQDEQSISTTTFQMASQLKLKALFIAHETGEYRAAVEVRNRHDHIVNSTSCHTAGVKAIRLEAGDACLFQILMTLNFEAGRYSFQLVLADNDPRPNRGVRLDGTPWLGPIDIIWNYDRDPAPFLGMFGPPVSVKFITNTSP